MEKCSYARHVYESVDEEPTLVFISKFDGKKNSGSKELNLRHQQLWKKKHQI